MKLSARNQLAGKVIEVRKGQTTSHVRIDIGNGVVVTSSITNESVDDLAIASGDNVVAVIKKRPMNWSQSARRVTTKDDLAMILSR